MHPVKRLRAEQRLSIRDLEARSGVPKGTISGIERGIRDPHALTLAKLADGLGVSVEELDPKASAPQQSGRTEAEFEAAKFEMRRVFKLMASPEGRKLAEMSIVEAAEEASLSFADVAEWMLELEEKRRERSA